MGNTDARPKRGRRAKSSPEAGSAGWEVATARTRRKGLTRLTRYVPSWRRVALLGFVAAVGAAGPVVGLLLVQDAIDHGISARNTHRLGVDVLIYLGVNGVAWVLQSYLIKGLAQLGQAIVLGLREHLFGHLTALSLRYFSEQRAGWIIARLTSDVDAISDVLSQGMSTLVSNTLTLVAAVIGLFVLDWRLGLVALIILPPTFVLTRWFQVRSHEAFLEVRNTISAMTAQIAESVAGMAVVQAFNRERAFQAEFDDANDANRKTNTRAQFLNSLFFPGIELFGIVAICSVLLVGARLHDEGSLTVGTLISAVFLLNLVFQPLQELSDLYGQVQSAAAAMEKITTVLDTDAEIRDKPDARRLGRLDGDIELEHVVFAYGKTPVIKGVNLHIPAGACIAMVGHTGHGKSTLAKLIGRFYDPDKGSIRVDGLDLRDIELHSYRRQLGVVLQDPFLFAGTIADNIRFARPDASDEQVRETAAAIGVDRVAARFDEGLEHLVREGGAGLSAGERQLISIARALLADPRILILDEATSNIDRPTERLIEQALDRLLHGRTSLIIAHRLATVRRADEILVIEHGQIAQRGTERELLAAEGPFRRLAYELKQGVDASALGLPATARRRPE
jgi:ABC-type multidrug transport system fused ATPase/permease subunit